MHITALFAKNFVFTVDKSNWPTWLSSLVSGSEDFGYSISQEIPYEDVEGKRGTYRVSSSIFEGDCILLSPKGIFCVLPRGSGFFMG